MHFLNASLVSFALKMGLKVEKRQKKKNNPQKIQKDPFFLWVVSDPDMILASLNPDQGSPPQVGVGTPILTSLAGALVAEVSLQSLEIVCKLHLASR